jgi:hypothetical protein
MRFKKSIPFFSHISHSHHIPYILCLIVIGVILIVIVVIVDDVDVVIVVVYFPSLVHSVSHPSRSPTTPSSSAICLPGSSARFVSTLLSLDLLLFLSDLPIFRDKYAPPEPHGLSFWCLLRIIRTHIHEPTSHSHHAVPLSERRPSHPRALPRVACRRWPCACPYPPAAGLVSARVSSAQC